MNEIVGYIAKIDGIEYQISKNHNDVGEAIKDALKLHEAFYEKEYLAGKVRGAEQVKKAKEGWYVLRGAAHTGKALVSGCYHFKNDKTIQYARTKNLNLVISTIVHAGSCNDRKLDGMTLIVPNGKTIKLPDLKNNLRRPNFFEKVDYPNSLRSSMFWLDNMRKAAEQEKLWTKEKMIEVKELLDKVLADE